MNAPVMVDVGDETDPLEVSCTLCVSLVLSLSGSHTAFALREFARAFISFCVPTRGGEVCNLAGWGSESVCACTPPTSLHTSRGNAAAPATDSHKSLDVLS